MQRVSATRKPPTRSRSHSGHPRRAHASAIHKVADATKSKGGRAHTLWQRVRREPTEEAHDKQQLLPVARGVVGPRATAASESLLRGTRRMEGSVEMVATKHTSNPRGSKRPIGEARHSPFGPTGALLNELTHAGQVSRSAPAAVVRGPRQATARVGPSYRGSPRRARCRARSA